LKQISEHLHDPVIMEWSTDQNKFTSTSFVCILSWYT